MFRLLALAAALSLFALASQAQQSNKGIFLPSKHSGAPPSVGQSEGDGLESPVQRQHRRNREEHLGQLNPFSGEAIADPGGQDESVELLFINEIAVRKPGTEDLIPEPHGIPAWGSNFVIVGTVLDGQSHMNDKHNYVYTDYRIQIDQIIKADKANPLTVGQQLTASRTGGRIRFPSGHISNFYIQGRGLPKVGSQYVLFLIKPTADLPEYRIAFPSSYELKDGKVYPLDDVNQEFEGFSANALLKIVRETIEASKGAKQ